MQRAVTDQEEQYCEHNAREPLLPHRTKSSTPTPSKQQGTRDQMPEAGDKQRWNGFDGVTDREVSGTPNYVNASEGNNDQQPIVALRVARFCFLVGNHLCLKLAKAQVERCSRTIEITD